MFNVFKKPATSPTAADFAADLQEPTDQRPPEEAPAPGTPPPPDPAQIDPQQYLGGPTPPPGPVKPGEKVLTNKQISDLVYLVVQEGAKDCPDEVLDELPSPQYLRTFYDILKADEALAKLNFGAELSPTTTALIAGGGTAIYIGLCFAKLARYRKKLSPQARAAAEAKARDAKRQEFGEMAAEHEAGV